MQVLCQTLVHSVGDTAVAPDVPLGTHHSVKGFLLQGFLQLEWAQGLKSPQKELLTSEDWEWVDE